MRTFAGASLLASLLRALAGSARAQDGAPAPTPPARPDGEAAPERRGRVTDVREAEGVGVSILVDLGSSAGVAPGQTVELRRDGKPVGYGSIDTAFADVAVATVGTIVSGAGSLKVGDEVIIRGAGFKRGPAEAPGPKGRVVGVRDAVVLLEIDGAGAAQVEVGAEAVIADANGQERGRVALELVHGSTAGGMLVSGSATAGDVVTVLKGTGPRGGIDYVALSFLGVVADLEHPTPHRAPCHVGVPVRRLMPGSPAQRAGISRGDRVIAVDGHIVRDATAIRERIEARVGDRVQVALVRNDRIINVDVVFR